MKDDACTDFYTAFATGKLRAAFPAVLCRVLLKLTIQKAENIAASVFIPICSDAASAW